MDLGVFYLMNAMHLRVCGQGYSPRGSAPAPNTP